VLLTGQSGFIGSHLRARLLRRGHDVPAVRVDLRAAVAPEAWLLHLSGVDVVINTAGIFRERQSGDFALVNEAAPCALFRAASAGGVRLIVQFSALGADAGAASRFHLSKRAADDCLRSLPVPSFILQPSLVFGPGGASARLMDTLASLPLIPVPGAGDQQIQPIHVDDLVEAVVKLVESAHPAAATTVHLVGPRAMSLRQYLAALRQGMGLPSARFVPMPMPAMRLLARLAAWMPATPVDPEALEMLDRGNTADVGPTREALGRLPRDPALFIPPDSASGLRLQASLGWLLPLLRVSIAVMWIWAAVVSVWFHPLAESYAMLAATGVPAALAPLALYGASAADLALGVLTLTLPRRRLLWLAQIALVLVYTVIIAVRLPEYLTHPFGPIVKNLPILAVMCLLAELDRTQRRPAAWNT
jgi:uncharacterized protein YbjT (DUF2867 family)